MEIGCVAFSAHTTRMVAITAMRVWVILSYRGMSRSKKSAVSVRFLPGISRDLDVSRDDGRGQRGVTLGFPHALTSSGCWEHSGTAC